MLVLRSVSPIDKDETLTLDSNLLEMDSYECFQKRGFVGLQNPYANLNLFVTLPDDLPFTDQTMLETRAMVIDE